MLWTVVNAAAYPLSLLFTHTPTHTHINFNVVETNPSFGLCLIPLFCLKLAEVSTERYALEVVCTCNTTQAPSADGQAGQRDTHILPIFIFAAQGKRRPQSAMLGEVLREIRGGKR